MRLTGEPGTHRKRDRRMIYLYANENSELARVLVRPDSPRPADPTSRMGPAKWRESHVRFLRSATHETALSYDTFCRFQKRVTSGNANSPLFEIAPVLVCLDHVASFIVNANDGIV